MDYAERQSPDGLTARLVAAVMALAVFDFFAAAVAAAARSEYLINATFGALAGQFGLLAGWVVLGRGPLLVRLPTVVLAASLQWTAFVLGVFTSIPISPPEEIVAAPLLFPLLLLAAGLPMWIFAVLAKFRLRFQGQIVGAAGGTTTAGQFGLRQMLVMTALISVSLGLVRAWCGLVAPPADARVAFDDFFQALLVCVGLTALGVLPCLAASVYLRTWALRLVVLGSYAFALGSVIMLTTVWLTGGGMIHGKLWIMMLCLVGPILLTLLGVPYVVGCDFVRLRGRVTQ